MHTRVTMYLSKDGDYVDLVIINPFRSVDYATDNIHPILKTAENCNSHDDVLTLLNSIKASDDCQKFLDLYHHHNFEYPGHGVSANFAFFNVPKGVAHEDSIDQLIEFVQKRKQDVLNPRRCSIM